MLSTNVLCIKKRKKRSYCISGGGSSVLRSLDYGSGSTEKNKRSSANMFHVTENTPPDMLAGAMDLTVHLTPSKRTVKMSVERSTPMMDLLVQIATNHHLQLSDYTLEALAMLPSSDATPSILPFKPNTPIGALDTQHVRVIPKKLGQAPKNATAQPFESTFRLKVHLPRNQLYVTRVSQSVLLENIMKKVCDEKRLDVNKFELRHPANLDQVLDPKLTLSDYKITEIHIVAKGTSNLSQLFSTSDIIALKKEEERKQFHTKTGGGVFNLIFKRGTAKPSSGSVSSENRSISPTHSDDSRSVTPPSVQQEIITPPPAAPVMERPKPPQRKRRPAPKPPQQKTELTICHSRNSSDSSGYHEASILSDNCNTSLPRRPKSTILLNGEHSQSTSNLSKMSGQSKSTSSLMANNYRKKKSAPPPPPPVLSSKSESPQEQPSPVVASQPPPPTPIQDGNGQISSSKSPPPLRPRSKISKPVARPRGSIASISETHESDNQQEFDRNMEFVLQLQKENANTLFSSSDFATPAVPTSEIPASSATQPEQATSQEQQVKPPEVVAYIPKTNSYFDSFTRKRGLKIGQSLNSESSSNSICSAMFDDNEDEEDVIEGLDVDLFTESQGTNSSGAQMVLNQLHGMHSLDKSTSASSLRSSNSIPAFIGGSTMKKWGNFEELHDLDNAARNAWVIGDASDSESTVSTRLEQAPPTPVESEEKPPEIIPQVPSPTPTAAEPDFDWQYQLPDAPQGFRDPSPVPPPTDAVDSVVTSPELFEKATNKDSDLTSVVSEEEKPVMNATLSLENLEKRKSLVYNRELATSLKMPQEKKQYPKLEKIEPPSPAPSKSTLPNFQITTYDKPKTKFNIFEDDTIRSNNNNTNLINRNTLIDSKSSSNLEKSGYVGKSMENISYRKGSLEQSYHYYRPPLPTKTFVSRSGSFSTDQSWAPSKPVARSKSQVALNKYKDNKSVTMLNQENLEKSNSLYDVSGLHSLDVMRRIQNTLNTPTTSTEELDKVVSYQEQPEVKREVQSFERSYVTPAINMGTWSDRPKVPVNVKEDPDYKFGRNNNTKLIVNTTSNSAKSHNSFEVRNVTIKVNGCEPISAQNTGNVVIKIGEASNGIVARKPLGNLHPNKTMPRPHSIAFNEDISRVPIVRSVELKKPYKDLQSNTSITQIYPNSFNSMTLNRSSYLSKNVESPSSFSMMYKSSEALPTASVVRGNSFAQNPTIRGFQRQTWANEYMQNNRDFSTNRSVPFSQSNLRRTESSNKGHHEVRAAQPPPPPPPAMAKLNKVPASAPKISNNNSSGDSRGMLLQAIRDFGGKKGLRAAKA